MAQQIKEVRVELITILCLFGSAFLARRDSLVRSLVAITITPVLCYFFLPRSRSIQRGHEPRLVSMLKRLYAPVLDLTLTRWRAVTVTAIVALVVGLLALSGAGQAFLSPFNERAARGQF